MTTQDFVSRARDVHGDKYDYSQSEYVNARTKLKIICKKHGLFEQTPDKHLNAKCGCPMCAGNVRCTTEEFIRKAHAVHGDRYDYSLVDYISNKRPVKIICKAHGVFFQMPDSHLGGHGCAYCAGNVRFDTASFVNRAVEIHGDTYDYSQVEYAGNRVPVTIICRRHGAFQQVPYVHLSGSGCPVCGFEASRMSRDEAAIHEKAVATFLDKYAVDNPMFIPEIRCKQKQSVSSDAVRKKRDATKRANNSFNTSLPEYRLGVLLKSVFGEDDVLQNYQSEMYPFKCDYYIKSRDMYIELNAHWSHGGHWCGPADAATISDWKTKSKFYQNAAETFAVRDVGKRNTAREHGLNYIVFWKSDLSDAKQWISLGCPDGMDWEMEYSWLSK